MVHGRMIPTWLVPTIASMAFGLICAFLIFAYRWMDSVKDNHLKHIQKAVESSADSALKTHSAMLELAIREEERFKAQAKDFEDMKYLIRTRGL